MKPLHTTDIVDLGVIEDAFTESFGTTAVNILLDSPHGRSFLIAELTRIREGLSDPELKRSYTRVIMQLRNSL